MLKELSINILLIEALEQMLDYAKFIKDLLTRKQIVSYECIDNVHHCSVVASRSLVDKKEDLGAFTISYIIAPFNFARALCDIEVNINLMPLVIFKLLGLEAPKLTLIRFLMG